VQVLVFSKTYCPYCTKAKRALASVGASPVVHELDERPDGEKIQEALQSVTGIRTVPQVFVGGKCIGGGDDTAKLASNGKLKDLIAAA
jgi:glutaredoxin 3